MSFRTIAFRAKFFIKKNFKKIIRSGALPSTFGRSVKSVNAVDSGKAFSIAKTYPGRQVSIALMGARGHGAKHIDNFLKIPECRISHICDVDIKVAHEAADYVEKLSGYRPVVIQDFRHALDDRHVDALSIASPHHWHAPAAIWAMQAGKHVYLEKPISHVFNEGEVIVAAAKKYNVVVQCGTQLRSNMSLRAAADYIKQGNLGEVKLAHCITYKPRPAMPPIVNDTFIPESVNYDLWCGPAATTQSVRSRFHYHWHWFWEFGNGALGNNGIHRIDAARIGLGLEGFGNKVISYGGRFGPLDNGETPNVQIVAHKFDDIWICHDICGLPKKKYKTVKNGIIFYGTDSLIIYQGGAAFLCDMDGNVLSRFPGKQENHYQNFVDSVISGNSEKIMGDIYQGHISSGLCHLGNISYRLGNVASDDQIKEAVESIKAPKRIAALLNRVRGNLVRNSDDRPLQLGRILNVDSATGHVRDDDEASKMLDKSYRDGFGFTLD